MIKIYCSVPDCGKYLGEAETDINGQVACPDHKPEDFLTWDQIRAERGTLLSASDWTQIPDCSLPAEKKAEWATYRQALRDLPQVFEKPKNVVWPTVPE